MSSRWQERYIRGPAEIRPDSVDPGAQALVLDIPDDYKYMDPELVELLKGSVEPLLD